MNGAEIDTLLLLSVSLMKLLGSTIDGDPGITDAVERHAGRQAVRERERLGDRVLLAPAARPETVV